MQGNNGYMADMEEIPTLVRSFVPANVAQADLMLRQLCGDLQLFLKEQLGINITVSVSNLHKSIYGISVAYEEASKAMEYKFVLGEGSMILPEDMECSDEGVYSYTMDKEQFLINCIKTGNGGQAVELIEKLFCNVKNVSNIRLMECLCCDIVATLIKILHKYDMHKLQMTEASLADEILSQKNVEAMKNMILDSVSALCEYFNEAQDNGLESKIKHYLEENYMRQDLSIAMIAEQLKIHYIYLSNTFKRQVGVGLLEYINRFRIKKAMRLLSGTDKNIDEVSSLVGYGSPKTFSRVFKQYTGYTPTGYRAHNTLQPKQNITKNRM